CCAEQWIGACHQVNTCSNHRCCVDQCRHGRRASHGIGQPGEQRQLRTFTNRPYKQQHGDGDHHTAIGTETLSCIEHLPESKRTDCFIHQEQSQQEAESSNTVHDKCFLGSIVICLFLEPEANEQVREKSYPFPADEHNEVVVAQYQQQHEEDEQVEV